MKISNDMQGVLIAAAVLSIFLVYLAGMLFSCVIFDRYTYNLGTESMQRIKYHQEKQ